MIHYGEKGRGEEGRYRKWVLKKTYTGTQCCGSGMFYPGPRCEQFFIPDPDSGSKHFFIPDPGSYIKRGKKNKNYLISCFLWFQEQVLKFKKILIPDPDPGAGKNSSQIRIPDTGGKKAPDPGSRIPDLDPQHWRNTSCWHEYILKNAARFE
jgi:hypothetical protein